MNTFDENWFCEGTVPGRRYGKISHCFHINQQIYKGNSKYQDIQIFDNEVYGRILVLDGIVQFSESDEFIYHEMFVHPALISHPNPKKILIIGGGDGGTLRECLRHNPEEVVQIELDQEVVDLSKEHLPFTHQGAFDDERLTLLFEDGCEYMKNCKEEFDAIFVDCSDPVGPSLALFSKEFYEDLSRALKKDGVAIFQVGSFLDPALLKETRENLQSVFQHTAVNKLTMPSYHCGEYAFMSASNVVDFEAVSEETLKERISRFDGQKPLKYYSPEIHLASQVIPESYTV